MVSMLVESSEVAREAVQRLRPGLHIAGRLWTRYGRRVRHAGLLLLYVLATVQFMGALIYLEWPYLNVPQWEQGHAALPFQTRLLLAPLYRYIDTAHWSTHLADTLAWHNSYFFPRGLNAHTMLEFWLGIPCVLLSGWVAVQFYKAGSRRHLVGPLVYPLFVLLCCVVYIVHTVQNFRFVYDMPSMAIFAVGLYLIYFRKATAWFVLLFAVGTLNRETTLLLLPFWALSQAVRPGGGMAWRKLVSARVLVVLALLVAYWVVWHRMVYSFFPGNPSEYYSRVHFNLRCFGKVRYWPQLAAAFGYTWPFLIAYRHKLRDAQLRAWLLVLPVWYSFMFYWGILTETRIFGELLPFLAPVCAILGEEVFAAKVLAEHRPVFEADASQRRDRAA